MPPIPDVETVPLMYQGGSDDLLGPHDDVPLPDEAHGIDFEGEFGVIVDDGADGLHARRLARQRIRLLVQINDVSLRGFGPREMRTGFGFFQAKPSSSFAPVAVTPDELGDAWRDARIHLDLRIEWNGEWFGDPNGRRDELRLRPAHRACRQDPAPVGRHHHRLAAPCRTPAARRARPASPSGAPSRQIAGGAPKTPFMRFGDRVRMEARLRDQPAVRLHRAAHRAVAQAPGVNAMPRFVDLSIYLENDVLSDPPPLAPKITYQKHADTLPEFMADAPRHQPRRTIPTARPPPPNG